MYILSTFRLIEYLYDVYNNSIPGLLTYSFYRILYGSYEIVIEAFMTLQEFIGKQKSYRENEK